VSCSVRTAGAVVLKFTAEVNWWVFLPLPEVSSKDKGTGLGGHREDCSGRPRETTSARRPRVTASPAYEAAAAIGRTAQSGPVNGRRRMIQASTGPSGVR
jgi:hypothetical protein